MLLRSRTRPGFSCVQGSGSNERLRIFRHHRNRILYTCYSLFLIFSLLFFYISDSRPRLSQGLTIYGLGKSSTFHTRWGVIGIDAWLQLDLKHFWIWELIRISSMSIISEKNGDLTIIYQRSKSSFFLFFHSSFPMIASLILQSWQIFDVSYETRGNWDWCMIAPGFEKFWNMRIH